MLIITSFIANINDFHWHTSRFRTPWSTERSLPSGVFDDPDLEESDQGHRQGGEGAAEAASPRDGGEGRVAGEGGEAEADIRWATGAFSTGFVLFYRILSFCKPVFMFTNQFLSFAIFLFFTGLRLLFISSLFFTSLRVYITGVVFSFRLLYFVFFTVFAFSVPIFVLSPLVLVLDTPVPHPTGLWKNITLDLISPLKDLSTPLNGGLFEDSSRINPLKSTVRESSVGIQTSRTFYEWGITFSLYKPRY